MIPKATLTPPNLKTFRVWCGLYGGHYDIIVFFREKPTHRMDKNDDTRSNGKYVDLLAEGQDGNIFADIATGTFEAWFPDADLTNHTDKNNVGRPNDTEIRYKDLFQIDLTLPTDENGDPEPIDFHCDWPHGK